MIDDDGIKALGEMKITMILAVRRKVRDSFNMN